MASSFDKFHNAVRDLLESYAKLEQDLEAEAEGDEEVLAASIAENAETAIESAMDDLDVEGSQVGELLSALSDALEAVDPAAFEGYEEDDSNEESSERDDNTVDYDEMDEDEDDEDEDEDY